MFSLPLCVMMVIVAIIAQVQTQCRCPTPAPIVVEACFGGYARVVVFGSNYFIAQFNDDDRVNRITAEMRCQSIGATLAVPTISNIGTNLDVIAQEQSVVPKLGAGYMAFVGGFTSFAIGGVVTDNGLVVTQADPANGVNNCLALRVNATLTEEVLSVDCAEPMYFVCVREGSPGCS